MTTPIVRHHRRIVVSAGAVPRLARFVSREKERFYLCGFAIEPHPVAGALIVATDGHRLGCIHDRFAVCPPAAAGLPAAVILARTPRLLAAARDKASYTVDGRRPWLVIDAEQWWQPPDPKVIEADAEAVAKTPKRRDPRACAEGTARLFWAATADEAAEAAARRDMPLVGLPDALVDGTFPHWQRVLPAPDGLLPGGHIALNPLYAADFAAAADPDMLGGGMTLFPAGEAGAVIVRLAAAPDFLGVLMPMRAGVATPWPDWMPPAWMPRPAREETRAEAAQ